MIESTARGNWKDLDRKLRPFVARRVATPTDIDDVLQEIFLRMQRGLSSLRDDERFGPWLFKVARTAIVDHRRRAARHGPAEHEHTAPEATLEDSDNDAVEQELAGYVAPFVALLPSPYREALTLTELEGLSQKHAAEMLGISLSGMKSRVQRGRARLRELFDACCEIALDVRGHVIGCEPRARGPVECKCRASAGHSTELIRRLGSTLAEKNPVSAGPLIGLVSKSAHITRR